MPGVFYTDANAYKIIKRDINKPKDYKWNLAANQVKQVASYFYPINSGIFIEDTMNEQMIVMNDRPQGGTSFVLGRIELMLNRVGST